MFELVWSLVAKYSEHPLLMLLLLLAAAFVVMGFVVQAVTGNGVASAFFVVYAVLSAFFSVAGYLVLFVAKLYTRIQSPPGASSRRSGQ